ncbi:hypothetical protein CAPTEDRAFT_203024 [Capitella teleta]|uniref:Major facilitator superfamily (MFS) profile domain-containing protein n=1 Tax=Capitella teleta TaxID=283909 RepID=R7TNB7_CAPTE|nr:hypothetical protein CAPTEDRAFT_203024 [Capitella teleta]|eukprot:ELT95134.1 hypothetical protein CAPTEDRAFT_203024 [Capitella teleta]
MDPNPILPSILSQVDGIELGANSSIDQIHLINHNGRYGYLAAAKGAAQFVLNPVIGILVSKIGYRKPMLVGASLLALSTVGMALVASSSYADAEERSRHMAIAVGGISLGATVGPVYGSLLYEFVGQKTPFLILAAVIAVVIVLQVITMRDEEQIKQHSPALSFVRLLCDPLILIVAGNILLVNLQFALLANFLPLRLIAMKYTATWQLGLAILPNTIGYLFACVASLKIPNFPKWLRTFVGLILSIPSLVMIAYLNNIVGLLVAVGFIGVGTGLVSASSQPILAHLVDVRHNSDLRLCLCNIRHGGAIYLGFEVLTGNFATEK